MSKFSSLSRNVIEYLKLRHETMKMSGSSMPDTLLSLESQVDIGLLAELQKLTVFQVAEIVKDSDNILDAPSSDAPVVCGVDAPSSDAPVVCGVDAPSSDAPVVCGVDAPKSLLDSIEDVAASVVTGLETAAVSIFS